MINYISIKSLLPGSGKTSLLCKVFAEAENLKDKVILTPSNKSRQVCIKYLVKYGIKHSMAERYVCTMRKFKGNYVVVMNNGKTEYIPSTTKTKTYKRFYNIFIDEYSMLSKWEIDDLIENVPIANIITAGDCNQFKPVPSNYVILDSKRNPVKTNSGEILQQIDKGELPDLKATTEIVLNKQLRSTDYKLVELLEAIKNGDVYTIFALLTDLVNKDERIFNYDAKGKSITGLNINIENFQAIAYTHRTCHIINNFVKDCKRFIVTNNDFGRELYKDEFYSLEEVSQHKMYKYEEVSQYDYKFDIDAWAKKIFSPAYAVNAHRLQGETIKDYKVGIVLYDILGLVWNADEAWKERAKDFKDLLTDEDRQKFAEDLNELGTTLDERIETFQKFLYVALSRATSMNQIHIFLDKVDINLLNYTISRFKPMENDWSDDAIFISADDEKIFDLFNFSERTDEDYENWKNKWRHTSYDLREIDYENRKPKSKIQDNEDIVKDAKEMSYKDWKLKYNKSMSSWKRCRK